MDDTRIQPQSTREFRELVMTNTIQGNRNYQILIDKGYFAEAESME